MLMVVASGGEYSKVKLGIGVDVIVKWGWMVVSGGVEVRGMDG